LDANITRMIKLMDNWIMTINEIRQELGKEPIESEVADTAVIKQWYVLVDDIWVSNIQQLPLPVPNT
jgi:hypothetical protein